MSGVAPSRVELLLERFDAGDERALARIISIVGAGGSAADRMLARLRDGMGRAHVVGITGAPGAGKSSLVLQLALSLRRQDLKVAILAVDPSSPFTGGALLGDRVRMGAVGGDQGVYMRSLASRGELGGLSLHARDVVDVLDAFGFDIVLLETVGAGQSEIDIVRHAHTVLLVCVPGLGDTVQAMKAGVMEVADIYAVNKSDLPDAARTAADIAGLLELSHPGAAGANRWGADAQVHGRSNSSHLAERYGLVAPGAMSWRPPILKTSATQETGIDELVLSIQEHRSFLIETGGWASRRRGAAARDILAAVGSLAAERLASGLDGLVADVADRRLDARSAAAILLSRMASVEGSAGKARGEEAA